MGPILGVADVERGTKNQHRGSLGRLPWRKCTFNCVWSSVDSFFIHIACIPINAELNLLLLSLSHFLRATALVTAETCDVLKGTWALESETPNSGQPRAQYVILWAQFHFLENGNDKNIYLLTSSTDVKEEHVFRNNIEGAENSHKKWILTYLLEWPETEGSCREGFVLSLEIHLPRSSLPEPADSTGTKFLSCPSVFLLFTASYRPFCSWCQQKPHSPLCPSDTMKMAASTSKQHIQLQLWSPFPF